MLLFVSMMACAVLAVMAHGWHDKTKEDQYLWFALGCTALFFLALGLYLSPVE